VSIVTGLQLIENMNKEKYHPVPIYITREGDWYTGDKLLDPGYYRDFDPTDEAITRVYLPANTRTRQLYAFNPKKRRFKKDNRVVRIDAAIPAMHGMNGEDGTLQGLLQLADIPYTSSGVLGSAVGMDKILMKAAFQGIGLSVLPYCFFERGQWEEDREAVLAMIEERLSYPVMVKPANLGSSIGISKGSDRESLIKAIETAVFYDRRILVERAVSELEEVNCSVRGFGREAICSVCEMPISWEGFLSYEDKYLRNSKAKGMESMGRKVPAPIPDEMTEKIKEYSRQAFWLLDCKGVVRIDYIIDKSDQSLYINEINTIPGSFAFYLWEHEGMQYRDFIDVLLEYAFRAHEEGRKNLYAYDSAILSNYQGASKLGGAKGGKLG
jgi:D-alanine-D-alanine ligase